MSAQTTETGYAVRPKGAASWWFESEDMERTPELRWPLSVEVYDSMRRQDAQVMSVLRAVTLPIRRTAWHVDPAGARPEVVELVAEDLGLPIKGQEPTGVRARGRFSWPDHLRLALLELVFGHSFFEQVYRIDERGRARLRKLGWRPPMTLSKISVASDGGLESIEQHGGKPIPVERLVAYVNEREGGNWLGQSLLRPAYKFWMLKDRALRVQSQTLDRNGLGVPVFTAPPVPDGTAEPDKWMDAQIKAGLEIATKLRSGESAGAAIAHGATLEMKGVTGELPDAEKPIRYYDEQIARAVLAHFLNLGTETGSWALGSTFADFFTLSLQTVALQVADVANQHVVEDLVDLNWGEDEPAPRLVFDEIGARHPATAQSLKFLTDAGLITHDPSLEAFVRSTYGLPLAEEHSTEIDTTEEA